MRGSVYVLAALLLLAPAGLRARAGEEPAKSPLKKEVNLEFTEQPLGGACRYVTGLGVRTACDKGLEKIPVTMRLLKAPLASVLRHLARQAGARAYLGTDGRVRISRLEFKAPEVPCLDAPPRLRKLTAADRRLLAASIRKLTASEELPERLAASEAIWQKVGPAALPEVRKLLKHRDRDVADRAGRIIDRLTKSGFRCFAERKLKKHVNFEFVKAPFNQVVAFLQGVSDINMVLDPACKTGSVKPVTLKMTQTELGEALYWILRLGGCEHRFADHAIYIRPLAKGAVPPPPPKTAATGTKGVKARLAKTVSLEFTTMPAGECINYIRGLTTVNVVTDPGCEKQGLLKKPISLKLEKKPLGTALAKVLDLGGMKMQSVGGAVYITPKKPPAEKKPAK